jgi:hypothetical protein
VSGYLVASLSAVSSTCCLKLEPEMAFLKAVEVGLFVATLTAVAAVTAGVAAAAVAAEMDAMVLAKQVPLKSHAMRLCVLKIAESALFSPEQVVALLTWLEPWHHQ